MMKSRLNHPILWLIAALTIIGAANAQVMTQDTTQSGLTYPKLTLRNLLSMSLADMREFSIEAEINGYLISMVDATSSFALKKPFAEPGSVLISKSKSNDGQKDKLRITIMQAVSKHKVEPLQNEFVKVLIMNGYVPSKVNGRDVFNLINKEMRLLMVISFSLETDIPEMLREEISFEMTKF